jgi:hypothetical protein
MGHPGRCSWRNWVVAAHRSGQKPLSLWPPYRSAESAAPPKGLRQRLVIQSEPKILTTTSPPKACVVLPPVQAGQRKIRTLNVSTGIQERKIREDPCNPWPKRSRSYRRTAAGNISSTSTMLVG